MSETIELFKSLGFPVAGYVTIFATTVFFIKRVLAVVERMLQKHDDERAKIFEFMRAANAEQTAIIKENTETSKKVISLLILVHRQLKEKAEREK
ncbi:MAG: hypothetical protein MJZ03_05025 [archaeon]|nr:hypothetical protein [archaeon]